MDSFLIAQKTWPVAGSFRISRSALTQIDTVWLILEQNGVFGRAECRPYARYGDSVESVTAQLETVRTQIMRLNFTGPHLADSRHADQINPSNISQCLPDGPARNALDCALWDLRAKLEQRPIWEALSLSVPKPRQTAFTLSLDRPDKMAQAAKDASAYPLLKIKIGGTDSAACVEAVSQARPDARLIVDANEALNPNTLPDFHSALLGLNIALIEQPLPAGSDGPDSLPNKKGGLTYCADESLHSAADLPRLKAAGYGAVNVKLDKCGGIGPAVNLIRQAKTMGFEVMAGCMVGSSLAMAPMMIVESLVDYIDLDGPLLLTEDCDNGLRYDGPMIYPPTPQLWG